MKYVHVKCNKIRKRMNDNTEDELTEQQINKELGFDTLS